jgi:hypothetical protein
MDVFLVPVAADRYEFYCEEPDDPETAEGAEPPKGFFRRIAHRVRAALAEAERERRSGGAAEAQGEASASFLGRLKVRTLRWAAVWFAEQRLLWQLRKQQDALLVHPDDLTGAQAHQLLKRSLQRDWERHRFWLVIDSLGLVGSGLLILLPGPNVIGYYFLVRTAGHYFSLRGARKGLSGVAWGTEPSAALTSLRALVAEPCEAREDRVQAVAESLRLEHFARFFQRAATP